MMVTRSVRVCTSAAFTCLIASSHAYANVLSLFPIGPEAKSAAIESAIDSRDPQGLLYNPAGIAAAKPGFHGELGAGKMSYTYEHPAYDPVRVSLFAPVISAGWRSTDVDHHFTWGLAVAPTAMTQLKVKGLPRRIQDGKPESLDINTTRKQFHLPIGGSYSFQGDPRKSIGLSLIATYDERKLIADSLVNSDRVVDMKAKGTFFRPELGGVYGCGPMDIGVSYMGAVTKHFKGSTTLNFRDEFDTELIDYDPAVLATGVRTTYDDWTLSVNINRIFGAKGASIHRNGILPKITDADIRDVNQFGARVGYKIDNNDSVSAAYAYLPTIWGAGLSYKDGDGFAVHEHGHLFGTFNAMPVRNQALFWRHHSDIVDLNSGVFRTAGKQTVDGNGDNPGFYQLEFVTLTAGIAKVL